MSDENFWADNPFELLSQDNFLNIIPSVDMDFATQLNSAVRFALYFAILMTVINKDIQYLLFLAFFLMVTIFMFRQHNETNTHEKYVQDALNIDKDKKSNRYRYKPTKNNPFMNVTFDNRKHFPNRPPAADVTNSTIKQRINKLFDQGQFHDADDIYKRNSSTRQFYTNPVTTIPNDQGSYANWLYGINGKTCKEGNGEKCLMTKR